MKHATFLKALMVVAFAISAIIINVYLAQLTSRGYLVPVGEYIYKFNTHGGAVYVNKIEHTLVLFYTYGIYITGVFILIIAFLFPKKK